MDGLNEYQKTLYYDLLNLTTTNEAFYFRDNIKDDITYRVFTYRLASYSDFLLPGALECRGVMFEIYNFTPIRLCSLPMNKFFNYKENEFTMNLDFHGARQIMYKIDGSLISTFLHKGDVHFKSKTALFSDHAIAATDYALYNNDTKNDNNGASLYEEFYVLERFGYTINCELTSPNYQFRIVVGYPETKLTILNIRNRKTGHYITLEQAQKILNDYFGKVEDRFITSHWVPRINIADDEMANFINSINGMSGIEGFVIELHNGQLVKLKTDWYRALHHVKDSINSMRRLFEAVLEETTDDLRSMLYDDPVSLQRIADMEIKVVHIYNTLVSCVETFYEENVHLCRKDYAIKGQKTLSRLEFGLAMSKYLGKPIDYKSQIKKNYKFFGIADDIIEDIE